MHECKVCIKMHINVENNIQKCIILRKNPLQRCVYWAKLHSKICLLGKIHPQMIDDFHENFNKQTNKFQNDVEMWKTENLETEQMREPRLDRFTHP